MVKIVKEECPTIERFNLLYVMVVLFSFTLEVRAKNLNSIYIKSICVYYDVTQFAVSLVSNTRTD